MVKRLVDLLLSATGLALLSPVWAALALWIKLDSPGPVFYRQERVGRFGKLFLIHKFRTMSEGSRGLEITVGADKRITRAGTFLRHLKLDELPQLIDVLLGHMSLVGPRPEVPGYVALYSPELREIVLSVRPGITDPASLIFRHESELLARAADPEHEYAQVVMPQKLQISANYVRQATFAGDMKLIFRTLCALHR